MRVHARIVALHRDLGAHAGIARGGNDFDQVLADFGHFQLEQLDQKFGGGTADEQLRAARFGGDLVQVTAHAVAGTHGFARNHLFAGNETLGIVTQIDVDVAALHALDLPHHQAALAIGVGVDDLAPLGFTHLLHDDLLGGLRGDTAELDGIDLFLDEIAELNIGVVDLRGFQRDLAQRLFEAAVFARFDDFPAPIGSVVAGLAIDIDAHLDVLLVLFARRRGERRFDRFKYDFAIDAFLVGDGVRY